MAPKSHVTYEVDRGPTGSEVGAFFDLDGTLISGFSVFAFLRDRLLSGRFTLQDLADMTPLKNQSLLSKYYHHTKHLYYHLTYFLSYVHINCIVL